MDKAICGPTPSDRSSESGEGCLRPARVLQQHPLPLPSLQLRRPLGSMGSPILACLGAQRNSRAKMAIVVSCRRLELPRDICSLTPCKATVPPMDILGSAPTFEQAQNRGSLCRLLHLRRERRIWRKSAAISLPLGPLCPLPKACHWPAGKLIARISSSETFTFTTCLEANHFTSFSLFVAKGKVSNP